jgi:hypothetical protein
LIFLDLLPYQALNELRTLRHNLDFQIAVVFISSYIGVNITPAFSEISVVNSFWRGVQNCYDIKTTWTFSQLPQTPVLQSFLYI